MVIALPQIGRRLIFSGFYLSVAVIVSPQIGSHKNVFEISEEE